MSSVPPPPHPPVPPQGVGYPPHPAGPGPQPYPPVAPYQQAPGAYPQHPYGQQVYVPAPPPNNTMAIVSFILSLVGFGLVAVILGHIALGQIRRDGSRGHGFALAGVIIGYAGIAITLFVLLIWVIAFIGFMGTMATVSTVPGY